MDYYDYNYEVNTTAADGGVWAVFAGFWLIWLAVAIVSIVGLWKVFTKAGRPGWAALIPVYNTLQLLWTAGRPWWWILLFAIAFIPFVGWIVAIILTFIVMNDLAKSFGKDIGWAILLTLVPFVGFPMLGFGNAKYKGPAASSGASAHPHKS